MSIRSPFFSFKKPKFIDAMQFKKYVGKPWNVSLSPDKRSYCTVTLRNLINYIRIDCIHARHNIRAVLIGVYPWITGLSLTATVKQILSYKLSFFGLVRKLFVGTLC